MMHVFVSGCASPDSWPSNDQPDKRYVNFVFVLLICMRENAWELQSPNGLLGRQASITMLGRQLGS